METVKVCSYLVLPSEAFAMSIDCSERSANTHHQNAANYVAESIQGTGAEASKEANKQVAKDSDASINTRASAAKDAVVDKKDEFSHNTKADTHKGRR